MLCAACGVRREAARDASCPPSLVVVVDHGWRGRRRRIAIFGDKLTNLGWLTVCVKYLMKTKKVYL
jgi:hypothetical protein